jgi:hypothetical protein
MSKRKKYSDFRNLRWVKLGFNEERAAEVLGVTVDQIKVWDYEEPPIMASRLLLAWDRKSVGHSGWDGWYFSRGALHYRDKQWRPESLLNSRFDDQRLVKMELSVREIFKGLGVTQYKPDFGYDRVKGGSHEV